MKKYRYEYEMCDEFIKLNSEHFDIYPECYGFDIYMFCKESGTQFGIQAKLSMNINVVTQAINSIYSYNRELKKYGPHYNCILTPTSESRVCEHLNILSIEPNTNLHYTLKDNYRLKHIYNVSVNEHACRYDKPEVRLNGSAGVPSPRNLSRWRISALKLMILYEKQGYILSSDVRKLGLNVSTLDKFFRYSYTEPKIRRCFKMVLRDPDVSPATNYEKEKNELKCRG